MANEPKLEPPIQALLDATNAGDNKAFVAAFTKDGSVNDWGELHQGRAEISRWDRSEHTGARVKLRVTGVSRLQGEVLVLLEVTRGDDNKSTSTFAFRLQGNKVASLEIG